MSARDDSMFRQLPESDLLALTLYGEARGEGLDGQLAVASVVLNRAKRGGWWGGTVHDVCLADGQFSCFNVDDPSIGMKADPNRDVLERMARDIQHQINSSSAFRACWWIARGALDGILASNVQGATHYHKNTTKPGWVGAKGMWHVCDVGSHRFYVEDQNRRQK